MLLELEKKDLINMIKGVMPYYSLFEILIEKDYGSYADKKSNNSWVWNEERLQKMSEDKLFELYETCVNSYK